MPSVGMPSSKMPGSTRGASCAYWPPKSSTSTGRSSGAGSGTGSRTTSAPIVRRLLRDRHVVRVRLAQARPRDPHERRVLQLADRGRAAVAHGLPEAADELVEHVPHRALVRDAALDPLRNHLLHVLDVTLEVAVLRKPTGLHRTDRAHAAVFLVALALAHHDVARALLGS